MVKKTYSVIVPIILLVLLIVSIGFIFLNVYSTTYFNNAIQEQFVSKLRIPGQLLVHNQISYDTFKDTDLLSELTNEKVTESIIIKDNTIFYSYLPELEGMNALDFFKNESVEYLLEIENGTRESRYMITREGKLTYLSVLTPLYQDDVNIGNAYIKIDISEFERNTQIMKNTFLIISIICMIMTSLLLIIFIRLRIIKPLSRLVSASEDIARGEFGNLIPITNIKHHDELSVLALSFNQMSGSLKASKEAIQEYSKDLEKKVYERTSKLEKQDTELLIINRQLEEANLKLKSLDAQKDEFISLVAHELKTPLTSIQGFTQVLLEKDKWGDPENKHYLETISKNANRLYNLVTDIVDSSRLNLGRLKFNIEVHDPYRIFNEVKDDMTITISKKGLTPEFIIEENLPKINADFERTMQVLHNLMSNSIKFTEQGIISLNVKKDGEFVKFEVKDTGQGIPDENKAALFSRFYQVDSAMTRKVGGSGLGLSICKGLVEGMGGKIGFESTAGKGSTFHFTLPTAKGIAKEDTEDQIQS